MNTLLVEILMGTGITISLTNDVITLYGSFSSKVYLTQTHAFDDILMNGIPSI